MVHGAENEMKKVSIIMAAGGGRTELLRNALKSWSKIKYENFDFILINNGNYLDVSIIAKEFSFITEFKSTYSEESINRIWRREGISSKGDYIVFTMADEILSNYDIINIMLNAPIESRCSINTYFLSALQTERLSEIEWLENPKLIEKLPKFWSHKDVEKLENSQRLSGGLLTHITGATKKYWEWFGWFRNEDEGNVNGYLLLDWDLHVREKVLKNLCYSIDNNCDTFCCDDYCYKRR